jgi:hypothetical protein
VGSTTVWCPSCGAEYVAGSRTCSECRVALVPERPRALDDAGAGGGGDDLIEMGEWPRLSAQILRRRLETAGVTVMVEWSGTGPDDVGVIVVPREQSDFAYAVINEIDVEDEVPDTSPLAYVTRVEEHLAAASALLEELRTRLDEAEDDDTP